MKAVHAERLRQQKEMFDRSRGMSQAAPPTAFVAKPETPQPVVVNKAAALEVVSEVEADSIDDLIKDENTPKKRGRPSPYK